MWFPHPVEVSSTSCGPMVHCIKLHLPENNFPGVIILTYNASGSNKYSLNDHLFVPRSVI